MYRNAIKIGWGSIFSNLNLKSGEFSAISGQKPGKFGDKLD